MADKYCINFNHPDIIKMAEQTGLPKSIIAIKAGSWMRDLDTDNFPTIKDLGLTNLQEARKWLKSKLGMDDSEIITVAGLIEGDSFGMFVEDGRIILSDAMLVGTEYHEAFERVFNMFLTKAQQQSLIKEYKERTKTDKSDSEIKEDLAEDFRMYVLTDGNMNLPPVQKSFFQKLVDFFKKLFSKDVSIEEVYKNIVDAKYTPDRIIKGYKPGKGKHYRKASIGAINLTATERKELLDGAANIVINEILNGNLNFSNLIIDKVKEGILYKQRELSKYISPYLNEDDSLNVQKYNALPPIPKSNLRGYIATNNKLVDLYDTLETTAGRVDFFKLLSEKLASSKINLSTKIIPRYNDKYDEPSNESKDEEDKKSRNNLDIRSSVEFDTKDNLPDTIRLLLSSVVKVDPQTKEKKVNSFGLPDTEDFGTVASKVINTLAAVPANIDTFIKELSKLSTSYPEINQIIEKLGGKSEKLLSKGILNIPFATRKLRNEFVVSFANTRNNFLIQQLKKGGDFIIIDTNTQQTLDQVKLEWSSNLQFQKYKDNEDFITTLKNLQNSRKNTTLKLLEALGISLPETMPVQSIEKELNNFISQIFAEYNNPRKKQQFNFREIYRNPDLSKAINQLLIKDSSYRKKIELQHINTENKTVYSISLNTYQSLLLDGINYYIDNISDPKERIEILKQEYPFLFNAYTANSLWLKKIEEGFRINNFLFDGQSIEQEQGGSHLSDLNEPDVFAIVYNATLRGINIAMKHSDRSMYPAYYLSRSSSLKLGDAAAELLVTGDNIDTLLNNATDIFVGYLKDEINRTKVLQSKDSPFNNVMYLKDKGQTPILFPYLDKVWSKLLSGELKPESFEIMSLIKKNLKEHIEVNNAKLEEWNNLIPGVDIKELLIGKNNKKENTEVSIATAVLNAMVNHVEETKLLSGDMALYKNPDDLSKRLNTQSSTGKVLIVDAENNAAIDEMNKQDKIKIENPDGTIVEAGYEKYGLGQNSNGIATELILTEQEFISRFREELQKVLGEEYMAAYESINENDGFSWINMFFYREFEYRAAEWTEGKNNTFKRELELFNGTIAERDAYVVPKGEDPIKWLKKNFENWTTLKPQYVGPNYTVTRDEYNSIPEDQRMNVVAIRKTAYMPLVPSVIKGTILEHMHKFMLYNGIDVIHTGGAAKGGSKEQRNFYSEEGNTTIDFDSMLTPELGEKQVGYLDLRFMKNQLKMNNYPKGLSTASTQSRKIITEGILIDGIPRDLLDKPEEIEKFKKASESEKRKISDSYNTLREYEETQSKIINTSLNNLLKEIQAVRTTDDSYEIQNFEKFVKLIRQQAVDRDSPDNILDAIDNWKMDRDNKWIETKPNYIKMQNILNSLITNRVLVEKRPGDMLAQAAPTGIEPIGTKRNIVDGKIESSPALNFYTFNKDGSLNPMEIIMPLPMSWIPVLMEKYKTRSLIELVNKVNADIESGELNTEVTFKGLRIPNQALGSNDVIKVKKFANPLLHNAVFIPTELVAKAGSDFDIDKLSIFFPNNKPEEEMSELEKLQNKLLNLEKKLILDPYRAKELFLPNGTTNIEAVAKELLGVDKKGRAKLTKFQDLLDIFKFVENNNAFVGGKQGVGQVATWITFLSVAQTSNLSVGTTYNTLNTKGQTVVKSTDLPFINVQGVYTLSRNTSIDGNLLSEAYSELLTSQVDNVKDPVAVALQIINQTLNPLCYMLLRGIPLKTAVKFLNQPAIKEYLKAQRLNESNIVVNAKKNKSLTELKQIYLNKYKDTDNSILLDEKNLSQELSGNQAFILKTFFDIVDQAKAVSEVKNYLSPDTKYLKDMNAVKSVLETLKANVEFSQIIPNYMDALSGNSLLSSFARGRELKYSLYQPLFLSEQRAYKEKLDNLKFTLSKLVHGEENKNKVQNKVNEGFINYLLQNYNKQFEGAFERLFIGTKDKPSLPERILQYKKGQFKLSKNLVIQTLQPLLNNATYQSNRVNNLAGIGRKLVTLETNLLIEAFEEIREIDPDLYNDLVLFNILQSGISNSPYQYDKIIPFDAMATVMLAIPLANERNPNIEDFINVFLTANPTLLPKAEQAAYYPSLPYYKAFNSNAKRWEAYYKDTNTPVPQRSDSFKYAILSKGDTPRVEVTKEQFTETTVIEQSKINLNENLNTTFHKLGLRNLKVSYNIYTAPIKSISKEAAFKNELLKALEYPHAIKDIDFSRFITASDLAKVNKLKPIAEEFNKLNMSLNQNDINDLKKYVELNQKLQKGMVEIFTPYLKQFGENVRFEYTNLRDVQEFETTVKTKKDPLSSYWNGLTNAQKESLAKSKFKIKSLEDLQNEYDMASSIGLSELEFINNLNECY